MRLLDVCSPFAFSIPHPALQRTDGRAFHIDHLSNRSGPGRVRGGGAR
jgi:hypothetical protein